MRRRRRRGGARFRWLLFFLGSIALFASACLVRPAGWTTVAPGMDYRSLMVTASEGGGRARLHALRIDPKRYSVRVVTAGSAGMATARQMAARHRALAVINGGFFDEQMRPLGLRVSGGKQLQGLRRANWGVFMIRRGQPAIVHTRDYNPRGVTEAIQCGPRLVVDGRVTHLKKQNAHRACVAIDRQGRVLLVVTEGLEMDATHLAEALRAPESEGGLGCRDALNLDGGPSAQLYVDHGRFRLDVPGVWGVPDGLGVFPR